MAGAWKGISFDVLQEAGVEVDPDGSLVRVPYRRPDGSLHRWRYFGSRCRSWWGPGDGLLPFGLETLPDPFDAAGRVLLLAEGESDALAIREAYLRHDVDVLGVPGASCWRSEWRRYLEPYAAVYVVGDGDAAGRRMAERVLEDAPWGRPVPMPDGMDARALLQSLGPRALDTLLLRADRRERSWYGIRHARSVDEFVAIVRGEERTRVAA